MYNYKNHNDDRNYENLQRRIRRILYSNYYYYFDNTGKMKRYNPYDNLFEIRNSKELMLYM